MTDSHRPDDPWLTIVTVVKDDPPGFDRTSASISEQELDGVEWVVVDGSEDPEAVPAAISATPLLTARYRWTEPAGVYPAMNAGLADATGTYILFLNAGDTLHGSGALATVRDIVIQDDPVWMYGQVSFISPRGDAVIPPSFDYQHEKAASFSRGRFPPHQGTVVRASALREVGGFDTTYRIVADYAAFLRISLLADPATTSAVIADFYEGGVSSTAWRSSLREFHRARREILRPTGLAGFRERWETGTQFVRMSAVRALRRAPS